MQIAYNNITTEVGVVVVVFIIDRSFFRVKDTGLPKDIWTTISAYLCVTGVATHLASASSLATILRLYNAMAVDVSKILSSEGDIASVSFFKLLVSTPLLVFSLWVLLKVPSESKLFVKGAGCSWFSWSFAIWFDSLLLIFDDFLENTLESFTE